MSEKRGNLYSYDPTSDICIVGGKILPANEQGPLDTDLDMADPLYDERVSKPLKDAFVATVEEFGVMTPVKVIKRDGVPCVIAGRRRAFRSSASTRPSSRRTLMTRPSSDR
jgi:hypothetical protein